MIKELKSCSVPFGGIQCCCHNEGWYIGPICDASRPGSRGYIEVGNGGLYQPKKIWVGDTDDLNACIDKCCKDEKTLFYATDPEWKGRGNC